ncbi:MAG: CaiB/BaiF CoA-transferase family protein [Proteobacteria bacterium]|nr:CaiB/BaiF CoA-transferase family protein [Pseudomonadota bacterium]MDA0993862.1 CaiB/BaiF CoA-transferase family protein [Pseudomonadota bacterium]
MKDASSHEQWPALKGIKVLDLSRVLAGPWATQLLADYGAEVIKVERPGSGDDTRSWGPPWLKDRDQNDTDDSAYFLSTNRNKRSLLANLGHPDGRRVVQELARASDVLVENFRVGTLKRYGLDYISLREINPALVYCSITAYGQTGSRADRPGYDAMIQASGGLMSITGASDAEGGTPQKAGVAIADIMAGMYATTAILAALIARNETGEGQHIDVPLYDTQVAWLANQNMNYLIGGKVPERQGTAHPNIVPYQTFATVDGHISLAVGNDRQFGACLTCLGLVELAADARFASNASRVANRHVLVPLLAEKFKELSTAEWLDKLQGENVPVGPINTIEDIFSENYAKERQLVRQVYREDAGDIPTVANPVRFSSTPVSYRNAPPRLGQHTADILSAELGYSDDEIEDLFSSGAI